MKRLPAGQRPVKSVVVVLCAAVALTLAGCRDSNGNRNGAQGEPAGNSAAEDVNARPQPSALSPEMGDIARLIVAGHHDLARLQLQRILSRRPDDGHAHFLFGLTFHREMRYGQARTHFERAIELAPGYHPAYHFYGYTLYYLGELEAARRAFETHLTYAPDEGDTHFGIGLIDLDDGELEAAEARFLRAIELETRAGRVDGVAKARARLGEAFERTGRVEEAREQLEIATELNPDLYEAFYMLYRVLLRLDDEEAAERALAAHEAARQRVRPQPPPPP